MTSEPDAAIADHGYLAETGQRMACATRRLAAIQRAGGGDLSEALSRLHEQQNASRKAGFLPIFRLCQTLESYLTLNGYLTASCPAQPYRRPVIAILLDVCRVIQLHADAVAKTTVYLNRRDVPRAVSTRIRQLLPPQFLS